MKNTVIALVLSLFSSLPAWAGKEVSGGNGAGGTLLDRSTYELGRRIDPEILMGLLQTQFRSEFTRFPFLSAFAFHYFKGAHRKAWYIEARELNPDCRNQVTISTREQVIWACQNDVEIRVNESWWNGAKDEARADLLLHELLTALRLRDGETQSVPPAFAALTNPALDDGAVANEFFRLGFPTWLTRAETDQAKLALAKFLPTICSDIPDSQLQARVWQYIDEMAKAPQANFRVNLLVSDTIFLILEEGPLYRGPASCLPLSKVANSFLENAYLARALH